MYRGLVRLCLLSLLLAPAAGRADPKPEAKVIKAPRKPGGTFEIGAGYGTLEGFIGHARVAQKRLFGVDGLKLSLDGRISAHRQGAQMLFGLDRGPVDPFFFEVGAHYRTMLLAPGDHEVEGIDAGGHVKAGVELAPGLKLAMGYRAGWLQLKQPWRLGGSGVNLPHAEGGFLSAPFLELTYENGPGWDPEAALPLGFRFSAKVQHASAYTGSDFEFTRLDVSARHGLALPLGMSLQSSISAGVIFSQQGQVPLFSRYRMGDPLSGSTALPQLGPLHRPNGVTYSLGGTGRLHSGISLHVPIIKRHLYALAGLEAGAVFSPDMPGQPSVSADMAGVLGLRWLSPLGPLSMGVSVPFNLGDRHDAEPRFMFMLGGRF